MFSCVIFSGFLVIINYSGQVIDNYNFLLNKSFIGKQLYT